MKEKPCTEERLFINDNKNSCHFTGEGKVTSHNAFISAIFCPKTMAF